MVATKPVVMMSTVLEPAVVVHGWINVEFALEVVLGIMLSRTRTVQAFASETLRVHQHR